MRLELACGDLSLDAGTSRFGDASQLRITSGGLDGWHSSPAPQQEGEALPAGGAVRPTNLTPAARVLTAHLFADAASTVEAQRVADILNGMFGRDIDIAVTDASGRRTAMGYLSDEPTVQLVGQEQKLLVDLVITCPDPNRYGAWETRDVTNGGSILQGGNAPSYPVIEATGECTALAVSINGHTLKWSGAGPVTIDLRDASATIGTVTVDDAAPLEPGRNNIEVSATGADSVIMRSRPAWR